MIFETDNALSFLPEDRDYHLLKDLRDSELKEYAGILGSHAYKNVQIDILDMSSKAPTGTFKDWVACSTIAYCKTHGIRNFVTQSSGNTANAIAHYCRSKKQNATIFYMEDNSWKLKPQFFKENNYVNLIKVSGSESRMKELTVQFSKAEKVPWLPTLDIQLFANSARANVVIEAMSSNKIRYDWHTQSLSSGYGVFGFYMGLRRENFVQPNTLKFLGVQQSAVCPYIRRISPNMLSGLNFEKEKLLEPTLFRSKPTEQLYKMMEAIFQEFGGGLSLVSNHDWLDYESIGNEFLAQYGLAISKDSNGGYVELSGMINLIGCMKAIDEGVIKKGERVLVAFTGGAGEPGIGKLG